MTIKQEKIWQSKFGREYIERNKFSNDELDQMYLDKFGISRSQINKEFIGKLKLNNILEVGCNIGNQLSLLQAQGFGNLNGIEISRDAVELAKKHTEGINIIQGSALDLPFRDKYFDLVFTSGVLIHISPHDIMKVLKEIHRTSKKYIWGYEYFSEKHLPIMYRGHKDRLWSGNFARLYLRLFPNLKLVKEKRLNFAEIGLSKTKNKMAETKELTATIFLLKK